MLTRTTYIMAYCTSHVPNSFISSLKPIGWLIKKVSDVSKKAITLSWWDHLRLTWPVLLDQWLSINQYMFCVAKLECGLRLVDQCPTGLQRPTTFTLTQWRHDAGCHMIIWTHRSSHLTFQNAYCQTSNISCTLVGNTIVDNSDVVGASLVSTAPTTSSFLAEHLASMDMAQPTAKRDEKHLSFGIWCPLC